MRIKIIVLLWLMLSACTAAPTQTPIALPSPTALSADAVAFDIFTLDAPAISGVGPAEWEQVRTGSYVRDTGTDRNTYLLHFANNQQTIDQSLAPVLDAFQQTELPTQSTTLATDFITWTLYTFTYVPTDSDLELQVDIATAANDTTSFVIALQTTPDEYTTLHETVFLPAVRAFGSSPDAIRSALGISEMVAVTVPDFGITTVHPDGWQVVNSGSWSRGDLQEDPTTLIVQTSPDLEATAFRDLFADNLNLTLEDAMGSYQSDSLTWTLYNVSITAQGTPLTWQIATAQDNQYAYLAVLLTFTQEADTLRERVLLPVLSATQPTQ